MSQPKSGFEIRADLLNQAQGLLEGNIYRTNEAVVEHNNNFPNDRKPYGDQFVSTEEVIAVATGFLEMPLISNVSLVINSPLFS